MPPEVVKWNEQDGLTRIKAFSRSRWSKLRSRRRDPFFAQNWEEAINLVGQSDFCRGNNNQQWTATFDWFLRAETVIRIMEGVYKNRDKPKEQENRPWTF